MKKTLLVLLSIIISHSVLFAQKKEKMSPSELMFQYYDDTFKPFEKKNWYVGLTFNIQDGSLKSTDNLIGLEQVLEADEFNYNITLKGGYFFSDYHMVGLGFSHGRDKSTGFGLILLDTLQAESISRVNDFIPYIRTYYPLSKNHRINFFNELKIKLGFGDGESTRNENGVQTEIANQESFTLGIGFSPGITFYAIESFAFEVQLDVLGYEYYTTTTTDQSGKETTYQTHNVNFTLNLLSLNFGLSYYFGAKN